MKPGAWWPVALVGVLGLTVAANTAMFVAARDPHASAVEPDYYRKAVAWDSSAAVARRGAALGWRLDAELLEAAASGAQVRVRIRDRAGRPLAGASVRVLAIHNRRADQPVASPLPEAAPGEYAARLPLDLPGRWELRIDVVRGDERWSTSLRREARWPTVTP